MKVHKVPFCPPALFLSLLLEASGFLGCWQIRGCVGEQREPKRELNFPQLFPLERGRVLRSCTGNGWCGEKGRDGVWRMKSQPKGLVAPPPLD